MNSSDMLKIIVISGSETFTEAATKLQQTQPAISMTVVRVEAEYGIKIFERTTHGVQKTTSEGAKLITHFKEILQKDNKFRKS